MSKKTIYIMRLGLIGGSVAKGQRAPSYLRFLDMSALTILEILHLGVASLTVQQVISRICSPREMLLSLQCQLNKLWPT